MQKFLQVFILASSVLIFSTSLALTLSQTAAPAVYLDDERKLKYATGSCQADSDCFTGGCSNEYCTSEKDLVSICIWSEDFPDKDVFRCGCWQPRLPDGQGNCAWLKK